MSTSTDAILFYGIPLQDLDKEDLVNIPNFGFIGEEVDYYEINRDWNKLKEPPQPDNADYKSEEWNIWRALLKEYEKSPQHVEIDSHCSGDYPMYYVHGRQFIAHRGDINEINLEKLATIPEDDDNIKEFCERYGLPYQQPKWFLVSYWG